MANITRKDDARIVEAKRQYASLANTLARAYAELEDINERNKTLAETMRKRNERELNEQKELRERRKLKLQQLSETVGGLKLAMALLKKWDVETPGTKLEKLAEKHEQIAELVE